MKIIDHYPSPPSTLTTIEIVDKLVESRPTGRRENVGLDEDPDLILAHQEQLLSLLEKMAELDGLNLAGFKVALESDSGDETSSADLTKRYIAWGSWLEDVMSPFQNMVYFQYEQSKTLYLDSLDSPKSSHMSLDEYYEMLYDRAMRGFPKKFPHLKPPYSTYRLYYKMRTGDWYKELKDLTDEYYKPTREVVENTISGFDQAFIGSDEHYPSMRQAMLAQIPIDLDVYRGNRYRLTFHNISKGGVGVPRISPRLRKIDCMHVFSSRGPEEANYYARRRERRIAKLKAIRESKGDRYPPIRSSGLGEDTTTESPDFDIDDVYKWSVDTETVFDILDKIDDHIMTRFYFALDPFGNHRDSEMFFACQVGFLERQRLNAHGPEARWENTGIFVAREFDPSQDVVQELFPDNAYARCIGARLGEGPGHVSVTTSGEPVYLQNGGVVCQAYAVYDSKEDINRFFSYDIHRIQLDKKMRRMRNEGTVHPTIRALCAKKSNNKNGHSDSNQQERPNFSTQ